jgi:hypothetical protein
MLGAIALSRAVSDEPLSSEILASVKELLVKDASRGSRKKAAKTADAVLTPERIPASKAARICGVHRRTLYGWSNRGKVPGAAKLVGTWTYDEKVLRKWIADKEREACQITFSSGATRMRLEIDRCVAAARASWCETPVREQCGTPSRPDGELASPRR